MHSSKKAFTLLEVMVAVLIVSVVIAAIFQVKGDANTKLFWVQERIKKAQYNTFFLGNTEKYGFEKSNVSLYELVSDFELEDDLRRELKALKINIDYDELEGIETPMGSVFEIGKTKLNAKEFDQSILRVRLQ
ncbi:MAG: prepilin-type N-terminal cleavage/methylation domain-containing protein [Campylobacterales bacterium]|nr:prepilin-type N-terminal cleavage/methylation domain-containing protein [Campylobacterales bacterium]